MYYRNVAIVGFVTLALAGGACNRNVSDSRDANARDEATREGDRTAERQQERDKDVSRLDERVMEIERDYTTANQKVVAGDRTATAGLREELQEDVVNVKKAVNDLRTTTPENWWDRHEDAMKQTADDIQADVSRLAGKIAPTPPPATSDAAGEKGEQRTVYLTP